MEREALPNIFIQYSDSDYLQFLNVGALHKIFPLEFLSVHSLGCFLSLRIYQLSTKEGTRERPPALHLENKYTLWYFQPFRFLTTPHCLLRPELVHEMVRQTKVQQHKSPARTFTSLAGQMCLVLRLVRISTRENSNRTPGSKQTEEGTPADNTLLSQVRTHGADDSSSWFSAKMRDHFLVRLWCGPECDRRIRTKGGKQDLVRFKLMFN